MTEQASSKKELKDWIKTQTDTALKELTAAQVVDGQFIEIKPEWVFPFTLLIGKIRNKETPESFLWFISGECPLTYAPATVAATKREAARYFFMQWQLGAERMQQKSIEDGIDQNLFEEQANKVRKQAEALAEIVESDEFWGTE